MANITEAIAADGKPINQGDTVTLSGVATTVTLGASNGLSTVLVTFPDGTTVTVPPTDIKASTQTL